MGNHCKDRNTVPAVKFQAEFGFILYNKKINNGNGNYKQADNTFRNLIQFFVT